MNNEFYLENYAYLCNCEWMKNHQIIYAYQYDRPHFNTY